MRTGQLSDEVVAELFRERDARMVAKKAAKSAFESTTTEVAATATAETKIEAAAALPAPLKTIVNELPSAAGHLTLVQFMMALHKLDRNGVPPKVLDTFTKELLVNPQTGLMQYVQSRDERMVIQQFAQGTLIMEMWCFLLSGLMITAGMTAIGLLPWGWTTFLLVALVCAIGISISEAGNKAKEMTTPSMVFGTIRLFTLLAWLIVMVEFFLPAAVPITAAISHYGFALSLPFLLGTAAICAKNHLIENKYWRGIDKANQLAVAAEQKAARAKEVAGTLVAFPDGEVAQLAADFAEQLEREARERASKVQQTELGSMAVKTAQDVSKESDPIKRAEIAMRGAAKCAVCANAGSDMPAEQIRSEAYRRYADRLLELLGNLPAARK